MFRSTSSCLGENKNHSLELVMGPGIHRRFKKEMDSGYFSSSSL